MPTATAKTKPDTYQCRALLDNVEVRDIDEETRTATFIAATENGVDTMFGREFLRMPGINLQRFRRNNVVLDTHNRARAGDIIGKAIVKPVDRKLEAIITFAETERAEEIWQLVSTGFLRALSIGFVADRSKVKELADGETDGEGDNQIVGPARIVRKWELFEISVVPVGADPDALKRSFLHGEDIEMIRMAQSLVDSTRRLLMESATKGTETMSDEGKEEVREETAAPPPEASQEVRNAEILEANKRGILAIAPRGFEDLADDCILQGKTVEESRVIFQEEHGKRMAKNAPPAGSLEPETESEEQRAEGEEKPKELDDVPDAVLVRAIGGE